MLPSLQFNGYLIHHLEIIITCCTTNSPVRRALGHASNGLQWTLTAPRVGKVWEVEEEGEEVETVSIKRPPQKTADITTAPSAAAAAAGGAN